MRLSFIAMAVVMTAGLSSALPGGHHHGGGNGYGNGGYGNGYGGGSGHGFQGPHHGGAHHGQAHHGSKKSNEHMPKHAGAAAGNSDTSGLLPDSRARGKRAGAARTEFMNESGYPNGRPGYVIDYIIPLNEGGKDSTYNMRWEATDDVKVKAPKHEMPERAPKAERSGEPREHHKPADQ